MPKVKILLRSRAGENDFSVTAIGEMTYGAVRTVTFSEGSGDEATETVVGVGEKVMTVERRGAYAALYRYREGETCRGEIATRFGSVPYEIATDSLRIRFSEEGLFASAKYVSVLGGERSSSSFTIAVTPCPDDPS